MAILDIVQIENEGEKEFNKSSSFFFRLYWVLLSFFFSLSFSLSLFSSKDCSSDSERLFPPLFSPVLSLSRTICFSISAYISLVLLISFENMQRWTKIATPPLSTLTRSTSSFSVSMQHIYNKKEKPEDDTRKTSRGNYVSMSRLNMPHE